MKKTVSHLALFLMILSLTFTAAATTINDFDSTSTIDAYWALVGKQNAVSDSPAHTALYNVMDGAYGNTADQQTLAAAYDQLVAVTNDDIATFAGTAKVPVAMVRHNYYKALTNALSAEIAQNPATGDERNLQIIFSLFLDVAGEDNDAAERERRTLRKQITQDQVASFAAMYGLPVSVLEFIIMSDDWDGAEWENDADWAEDMGWNLDQWADNSDVRRLMGDEAVVSLSTVYDALTASGYTFKDGDSKYGVTDYGVTDYGKTDYGKTDYGKTDYNDSKTDYGKSDYNDSKTDYGKSDYGKSDYGKSDYGKSDYGKSDYGKSDYGKSDYGRSDYD